MDKDTGPKNEAEESNPLERLEKLEALCAGKFSFIDDFLKQTYQTVTHLTTQVNVLTSMLVRRNIFTPPEFEQEYKRLAEEWRKEMLKQAESHGQEENDG